jgi:hypothetical protein
MEIYHKQFMENYYKSDFQCFCGFHINKGYHCHDILWCTLKECERQVNRMTSSGTMSYSGQDMSYYHNELEKRRTECKSGFMSRIQNECLIKLNSSKQILVSEDIFIDFIKEYPKYAVFFF